MHYRKRKIIVVVVLLLVLCVTIVAVYDYMRYAREGNGDIPSQSGHGVIYYEGEAYKYNQQIKNILFLGIDNDSKINDTNMTGAGGQADCIILFSFNQQEKTVKLIQIPRDTMTEIDIYDDNGNYYTSLKGQLALQYAYTNGAKTGCWATRKTVSELLYQLPIDGYIAMDIAAIARLNDMLGGVTMTMDEDYTDVDSTFVKDATVTFTGEQAKRFVQYRDTDKAGSSHERMQRQSKFLPALFKAMEKEVGDHKTKQEDLYNQLMDYVETNLSGDDIGKLMGYSSEIQEQIFLEGEVVEGEKFEEFYLDQDKLKSVIINNFYKKK